MKRAILTSLACGWFLAAIAAAEQVELTTYYPAPFGVYDTVVAEKLVDYNDGNYHVPPVDGSDWYVDPSAKGDPNSHSAVLRGNVGIGVTPRYKLDLAGVLNLNTSSYLRWNDSIAGGSPAEFWIGRGGASGPTLAFYAPAGNGLEWGIANAAKMVMNASGQVGIGTSNPTSALTIGTPSANIVLAGSVENVIGMRNINSPNPAWAISNRTDVGGPNNDFKLLRYDGGYFKGIAMQVQQSTGNVGLNTSTPEGNLDIQGRASEHAVLRLSSQVGGVPMVRFWNGSAPSTVAAYTMYTNPSGAFEIAPANGSFIPTLPAPIHIAPNGLTMGIRVNQSPDQTLSVGGGLNVDANDTNTGQISGSSGLKFGFQSGEGIASTRSGGPNQYGLTFYSAWQPRMVVSNRGYVGIGTTDPDHMLYVNGNGFINEDGTYIDLHGRRDSVLDVTQANHQNKRLLSLHAGQNSGRLIDVYRWNGGGYDQMFYVDQAGNGYFKGSVTSQSTLSDARLKRDIAPLTHVLERLQQVRGVSFTWDQAAQSMGQEPGQRDIGVIAQEVQQVFPELVTPLRTDPAYLGMRYDRLSVILINAINELKAQHDAELRELRATNAQLQRRVEALEQP